MTPHTVSACHCLKIIPLSRIKKFARIKSRVIMRLSGNADDARAVPGTIRLSYTTENGVVKKKITFERSDVSETVADILDAYKVSRLIATYIDESGEHRVAGSPDYPLALDYVTEGGVFTVALQGEDTDQDAFLTD